MKLIILLCVATIATVESWHTFLGTSVGRPLVYQYSAEYKPKVFQKRVETVHYSMPNLPDNRGRVIQGILAYDGTHSTATANVTNGGVGFPYVSLRMKSPRGEKLHYDIYIYA